MLANERTFLAYVRTGFAFIASGGTIWKLFPDDPTLTNLAFALLALGTIATAIGGYRFLKIRSSMKQMLEHPPNQRSTSQNETAG